MLGYAKAINQQEKKRGSLFQKLFRRKHIDSEAYLAQVALYIHRNPVHHNIAIELSEWPWTSYKSIVTNKPTKLKRDELLKWFNGENNFTHLHLQNVENWRDEQKWLLEEA